jgi:hypothetical protein
MKIENKLYKFKDWSKKDSELFLKDHCSPDLSKLFETVCIALENVEVEVHGTWVAITRNIVDSLFDSKEILGEVEAYSIAHNFPNCIEKLDYKLINALDLKRVYKNYCIEVLKCLTKSNMIEGADCGENTHLFK